MWNRRIAIRHLVERFPRLARLYRGIRDLIDNSSSAPVTPWGFTLAGHADMASGDFEPDETRLVRCLLKEVDIFVNIGANVGYYCCHALSMGKAVIAVEPIPRNVHYLLRNIRENGWSKRAEVYPVALGTQVDILNIWGGGTAASLIKGWAGIQESYVTQVPVLTLERVLGSALENRKALILLDVEGAEYEILQGSLKTLNLNPRPIWFVEIMASEHLPQGIDFNPNFVSIFEFFYKNSYTAITADKYQKPVSLDQVIAFVNGQKPIEAHNFIFR